MKCAERYAAMSEGLDIHSFISVQFASGIKGRLPLYKLNRWLGFIQGTLIALSITTVEMERNWSRPLFAPLDALLSRLPSADRLAQCEASLSIYDAGHDSEYWLRNPSGEATEEDMTPMRERAAKVAGPVETLCNEIGFRFTRPMERPELLVAFVRVLVGRVSEMRAWGIRISELTGKRTSENSAEVLAQVEAMLALTDHKEMVVRCGAVHDFIHAVQPDDLTPCDHFIDMLLSCVSAVRFGLETPHMSRHAASAAQHVWRHLYGVSLFDSNTPAWENDWARMQLQGAIFSLVADDPNPSTP
jgi:hypothetical protein